MPLKFDKKDLADIAAAQDAGGDIWNNEVLKRVKRKIKYYLLAVPAAQCCYCARLMHGEFNMVIDIEHVLPKSLYESEMFNMENLNIACKRCNMEIKKNDVSFLVDTAQMGTDYYNSSHYYFVHPNLDEYSDHINVQIYRNADLVLIKYSVKTEEKGNYTYKYFHLKELEIDTLNISQGLSEATILSGKISEDLRTEIFNLLNRLES